MAIVENGLRWFQFMQRAGVTKNPLPVYLELTERYTESHRKYHNLDHLNHSLKELEKVRGRAKNPNALELALWYHDFIYDRREDDEERSAIIVIQAADQLSISSLGTRASRLILATKHDALPKKDDEKLLVDIDLSILGQNDEVFDEYERNIRREYDFVSPEDFIRGRMKVLQIFLGRIHIYSTIHFHAKYEARARENLARSLNRLSQGIILD